MECHSHEELPEVFGFRNPQSTLLESWRTHDEERPGVVRIQHGDGLRRDRYRISPGDPEFHLMRDFEDVVCTTGKAQTVGQLPVRRKKLPIRIDMPRVLLVVENHPR